MAILRASVYAEFGKLTLLLNAQTLLTGTGISEAELIKGEEYVLQWFAQGRPGSSISITVSSPVEAEFHLTRVLGTTGKEFGGIRFKA